MQQRGIAALAAEADVGAARHSQQLDAAFGKGLRRGHSPRSRQLQHQIRTAVHRHLPTGELVHQRGLAPLDKVAAHGADHGVRAMLPQLSHQVGMAAVERIEFTDDPRNGHMGCSFPGHFLSFYPMRQANAT